MARKKRPEGTRAPNGAGSIYYSERDGKWHGRITMGVRADGKPDRRHIERKTEREVLDELRRLEKDRETGRIRPSGKKWTVEEWLTHWVENIAAPTVRRNTMVGYRAAIYGHLIPGIGAHRLGKLQPEHLETLYKRLAHKRGKHGKLLRPATIHQAHRTMRTALGEAVRRGYLTTNPAQIARPPRIPDEEIVPFTMEEARKILLACKERRNGARFVVALTLGLRKGEALGLQWRDLDFTKRTLSIRRQIQPVKWEHGCPPENRCSHRQAGHCPHRTNGGPVATEVKSRSGRRTIGLPQPVIDVLAKHRSDQQAERDTAGDLWREQGWVFANPTGRPVNPRTDHEEWKALLTAAGVRNARLHDARHTTATMLLVLGVPSRAVMDVMGWSNVGMTTRYQHITSELTVSIADQIGDLFWNESGDERDDSEGDDPTPTNA